MIFFFHFIFLEIYKIKERDARILCIELQGFFSQRWSDIIKIKNLDGDIANSILVFLFLYKIIFFPLPDGLGFVENWIEVVLFMHQAIILIIKLVKQFQPTRKRGKFSLDSVSSRENNFSKNYGAMKTEKELE